MKKLNKHILDTFTSAISSKKISSEEIVILSYKLGCVAFFAYIYEKNRFDLGIIDEWLASYCEPENSHNVNLSQIQNNRINAEFLVSISVSLGFLSYQGNFIKFRNKFIKDYFAIFYCSSNPLDAFILENTPQHLWSLWAKVDSNLPDKLMLYMVDHLGDQSQRDAFSALFTIGNKRVRKLLIQMLDNSESNIRSMAAGLLGKLNEVKAVENLINTLSDQEATVRMSSAEALGEIGDERAVDALLISLKDSNPEVIRAAVYALGYIGNKLAVEPIILILDNNNLAYSAAISLGNLKDEKAVDSLITKLNKGSEETQYWVINALGKIGDKKAIEPLLEIFMSTNNQKLLSQTAWALGELGEKKVFDYLIKDFLDAGKAFDPQNPFKGENAADALGVLKDKRAIPFLISLLNSDSWFFRQKIVETLGKIKDPTSKDALTRMLLDKDDDVRTSALEALEEFDN